MRIVHTAMGFEAAERAPELYGVHGTTRTLLATISDDVDAARRRPLAPTIRSTRRQA